MWNNSAGGTAGGEGCGRCAHCEGDWLEEKGVGDVRIVRKRLAGGEGYGGVCIVRERLAGGEGCGGCVHCEEETGWRRRVWGMCAL